MADLGATAYSAEGGDFFVARRVSGTVLDDAGNPARRQVMTLARYNAITGLPGMIQTGFSDPTTGDYALGCGFNPEVTVIALDDAAGTSYNALVFDKVVPA